jgi:hypothetical protein
LQLIVDPLGSERTAVVESDEKNEDIAAARSDYLRRWRLLWFVFFAYLPLGALFMLYVPIDAMYFALPWMALFGIAGVRLGYFRCPSCHELPFMKAMWNNPFSRRCLHCGLELRA